MTLGFLELPTLYTLLHVFGALLGAGAAFTSDGIFFNSVRDGKLTEAELRLLRVGSRVVWAGVALLVVSGALLFSLTPAEYLASAKFLAKMTIVAVIVANGIVFHFAHLPLLRGTLDVPFSASPLFRKRASLLMASGAVSSVSWVSAIVLGTLHYLPYSYGTIMAVYLCVVAIAVTVAVLSRKRILHL